MSIKILSLVQLPPPIHGAAVVNKMVISFFQGWKGFDSKTIDLRFVEDFKDFGSNKIKKILISLVIVFKIIWNILKFRPHFVYFNLSPMGFAFYRDVVFVSILKALRQNIVFHLHGKGVQENAKGVIKNKLYQFCFKGADVILLSSYLYIDIAKYVLPDRCYFLANAVDNPRIDFSLRDSEEAIVRVLFLANMDERKGVFDLIDAIAPLMLENENIRLTIAGQYTRFLNEEKLKKYVATSFGVNAYRVNICGSVYGELKKRVFTESDVFVYPTKHDAFPLVVLEALSYRLPVISTYEGAIPEMVVDGYNGYLVDQGDTIALMGILQGFLEDQYLISEFGENSFKLFNKKFTKEIFETNLRKIFDLLTVSGGINGGH